MVTHQNFIVQNNNKFLDFDNKYGAQCVDLARFYWQEVLGVKQPRGVEGAKDFWANYSTDPNLNQQFDRIVNTPEFVPKAGDTVIWSMGQYGHIAVVATDDNTTSQFTAFSQNDPTGAPCKLVKYNYNNVYGVFRKKGNAMADMYGTPNQYDLSNRDSMKVAVDHLNDIQTGKYIRKADADKLVVDATTKATEEGYRRGFERGFIEGKNSVPQAPTPPVTPSNEPPQEITLANGEKWVLNGLSWSEGKLQGNYKRN